MIQLIILFWLHIIGDFAFQWRYLAENKSKNPLILLYHCGLYCIPFFVISPAFAIITGLLHFPIDFISSKLTHRYHEEKNNYGFFLTIGIDQGIHFTILSLTYILLV